MKSFLKMSGAFAMLVVAAAVTLAPTASARTVGSASGAAYSTGDVSCFSNDHGAADNNGSCSGSRTWLVSLPVDSAQAYNPTIWYAEAALLSVYVRCETATRYDNGSSYGITGYQVPNSDNQTSGSFQPGSETVPADGYLWVACNMTGSGAEIFSIAW